MYNTLRSITWLLMKMLGRPPHKRNLSELITEKGAEGGKVYVGLDAERTRDVVVGIESRCWIDKHDDAWGFSRCLSTVGGAGYWRQRCDRRPRIRRKQKTRKGRVKPCGLFTLNNLDSMFTLCDWNTSLSLSGGNLLLKILTKVGIIKNWGS